MNIRKARYYIWNCVPWVKKFTLRAQADCNPASLPREEAAELIQHISHKHGLQFKVERKITQFTAATWKAQHVNPPSPLPLTKWSRCFFKLDKMWRSTSALLPERGGERAHRIQPTASPRSSTDTCSVCVMVKDEGCYKKFEQIQMLGNQRGNFQGFGVGAIALNKEIKTHLFLVFGLQA